MPARGLTDVAASHFPERRSLGRSLLRLFLGENVPSAASFGDEERGNDRLRRSGGGKPGANGGPPTWLSKAGNSKAGSSKAGSSKAGSPRDHGSRALRQGPAGSAGGSPGQGPSRPQGSRSQGRGSRPRFGWALKWSLPLVLIGVAAIATLVGRPSASITAAVAILLAAVAALLGWILGEERRAELRAEIESRTNELGRALSELEVAQAETVRRLSMAVEFRDEDTGAHIERIGRFSALLAEQLRLEPEFCERLSHAAPLHDVGKVAIPDAILLKPGPLTEQERAIVETHAEEGHRLLRGSSSSILDLAATIALSHHEKWDGSGYPRGLIGESIPIEGRIVAIADVFDALTSDRVYRQAFSVQEAVSMMTAQRGKHFDPDLLDAFLEVLGASGPEAKPKLDADPVEILEQAFLQYSAAIERGDAEAAEGVIAQAIEDGISQASLHEDVIGAAMRRIGALWEEGSIDVSAEHLATGISRRILATMHRYMLRGSEPHRERILILGLDDDDHTLSLQMAHDQLAAAGFQAALDTAVTLQSLSALIQSQSPQAVVIGASYSDVSPAVEEVVEELLSSHPSLLVLLGGTGIPKSLRQQKGVRYLERVADVVPAVEALLDAQASVLG